MSSRPVSWLLVSIVKKNWYVLVSWDRGYGLVNPDVYLIILRCLYLDRALMQSKQGEMNWRRINGGGGGHLPKMDVGLILKNQTTYISLVYVMMCLILMSTTRKSNCCVQTANESLCNKKKITQFSEKHSVIISDFQLKKSFWIQ